MDTVLAFVNSYFSGFTFDPCEIRVGISLILQNPWLQSTKAVNALLLGNKTEVHSLMVKVSSLWSDGQIWLILGTGYMICPWVGHFFSRCSSLLDRNYVPGFLLRWLSPLSCHSSVFHRMKDRRASICFCLLWHLKQICLSYYVPIFH